MQRTRSTALAAAAVVAIAALTVATPAPACSIRGSHCGYPLWAANAFEERWDRVNPATGPNIPLVAGGYEARAREHAARGAGRASQAHRRNKR